MFSSFSGGSAEPQRLDQGAGCPAQPSNPAQITPYRAPGVQVNQLSTPVGVCLGQCGRGFTVTSWS